MFILVDSVCKLNKDPGPCEAAIPRFYYISKTKRCEMFPYGGCEGNGNRFQSLYGCRKQYERPIGKSMYTIRRIL